MWRLSLQPGNLEVGCQGRDRIQDYYKVSSLSSWEDGGMLIENQELGREEAAVGRQEERKDLKNLLWDMLHFRCQWNS